MTSGIYETTTELADKYELNQYQAAVLDLYAQSKNPRNPNATTIEMENREIFKIAKKKGSSPKLRKAMLEYDRMSRTMPKRILIVKRGIS